MTRNLSGLNYRVSNREDEITFYCGRQTNYVVEYMVQQVKLCLK